MFQQKIQTSKQKTQKTYIYFFVQTGDLVVVKVEALYTSQPGKSGRRGDFDLIVRKGEVRHALEPGEGVGRHGANLVIVKVEVLYTSQVYTRIFIYVYICYTNIIHTYIYIHIYTYIYMVYLHIYLYVYIYCMESERDRDRERESERERVSEWVSERRSRRCTPPAKVVGARALIWSSDYVVALVSRIDKIIGLFCKRGI